MGESSAPIAGIWADADQQSVYAFQDNEQLTYWNKTKYHSDPNASYVRSDGTWATKEPMCWIGKRTGNVILSANGLKCCMHAEASGDKLTLTPVWGEPRSEFGLCRDQVLSRIGNAPDDIPGTAHR
jgi:hypothetical protein